MRYPSLTLASMVFVLVIFALGTEVIAQSQTTTLVASNGAPSSLKCRTNQVVTVQSFITGVGSSGGTATFSFQDGNSITIGSYPFGRVTSSENSMTAIPNAVFAGVTNIVVSPLFGTFPSVSALTITLTTPTPESYLPASTVVIPSDATGPVQIVLESSSDLLNWSSALPGIYGQTYSNRFFRVRAVAQ